MSVWAYGVFGNDEAADLAFDVDDAASPEEVEGVLTNAIDTVLRVPTGADRGGVRAAVAAAALVARAAGADLTLEDMEIYGPESWEPATLSPSPPLAAEARLLVELVCRPLDAQPWNEEEPLWDSPDDHDAYLCEVVLVRDALSASQ